MAQVLPDAIERLNFSDRYGIREYLKHAAKMIISEDYTIPNNRVTDMGLRVVQDLTDAGVSDENLRQAIYLFYRDYPETVDELRKINDGQDYLSELENLVNQK